MSLAFGLFPFSIFPLILGHLALLPFQFSQALFLLNHPFTLAQAEALSAAAAKAGADAKERVCWLWQRVFQRELTPTEMALANRALGDAPDAARWTAFCQMLLCSNEFSYVD